MFQDGPVETISPESTEVPSIAAVTVLPGSLQARFFLKGFSHSNNSLWPRSAKIPPTLVTLYRPGRLSTMNSRGPMSRGERRALAIFPTASFPAISSLFTLFSKFFSSFLHSTCSLSVSHEYLVLEEVYLPIRAAVQNNPTRRMHT